MSVLSEVSVISTDGNTRTTIQYSGKDQYVELSQSKINQPGNRKHTRIIQLTPDVMSAADAFIFSSAVEQAFDIVFANADDSDSDLFEA